MPTSAYRQQHSIRSNKPMACTTAAWIMAKECCDYKPVVDLSIRLIEPSCRVIGGDDHHEDIPDPRDHRNRQGTPATSRDHPARRTSWDRPISGRHRPLEHRSAGTPRFRRRCCEEDRSADANLVVGLSHPGDGMGAMVASTNKPAVASPVMCQLTKKWSRVAAEPATSPKAATPMAPPTWRPLSLNSEANPARAGLRVCRLFSSRRAPV